LELTNAGITCPECGSKKVWKDGVRYTKYGEVQRYLCRSCGYRFSETQLRKCSNRKTSNNFYRQVCAPANGAKNLAKAKAVLALREKTSKSERWAAGATKKLNDAEVKGKLFEFAWWMKKQGYAEETIRCYTTCLKVLYFRGADLNDPESVKGIIARQKWSNARKCNAVKAYTLFLKMHGRRWDPPKYRVTRKLPFIPTEQEIDTLIAGCGKKLAAFLQLLKETGMRAGEAKRIRWTDIDFERRIITLNEPEKGGKPRMWKVSAKLIGMLNALPRKSERVFGDGPINSLKGTFLRARKRLAAKLQNPRLLKISFHTLRHWRATMEYHRTKDIIHVKEFLGHKDVKNTEIYITVERVIFGESSADEFHVKVAKTPEEIKQLLEVGYDFICEKDGLLFFRKRK